MDIVESDGIIDVTSTDVNAQDEIVASTPVNQAGSHVYPAKGVTIQAIESNNNAVNIQPWMSIDGSVWRKIEFTDTQDHIAVSANGTELVGVHNSLKFLYFKLTGYVASGTSKVAAKILMNQ